MNSRPKAAGSWAAAVAIAFCCLSVQAHQSAQPPPSIAGNHIPPEANTAPASDWITRCGSGTRTGSLECAMEQSVAKNDTRQLVAMFTVRIPSDTRAAVIMIQLPLGLFLPAGLELQVDQGPTQNLPLQTCDTGGCYAGAPLSNELLQQLQAGKTLRLTFQNLSQLKLDVTMPLAGFRAGFDSIR